jgi:hypothetical protein
LRQGAVLVEGPLGPTGGEEALAARKLATEAADVLEAKRAGRRNDANNRVVPPSSKLLNLLNEALAVDADADPATVLGIENEPAAHTAAASRLRPGGASFTDAERHAAALAAVDALAAGRARSEAAKDAAQALNDDAARLRMQRLRRYVPRGADPAAAHRLADLKAAVSPLSDALGPASSGSKALARAAAEAAAEYVAARANGGKELAALATPLGDAETLKELLQRRATEAKGRKLSSTAAPWTAVEKALAASEEDAEAREAPRRAVMMRAPVMPVLAALEEMQAADEKTIAQAGGQDAQAEERMLRREEVLVRLHEE